MPPVKACLGSASCGPAQRQRRPLPSLKDCEEQHGRDLLWRARPDPDTGTRGPRASPCDLSSLVCSLLSFCGIMSFLNSGKFPALTFPILPLWLCPHLVSAPGDLLLQTPVPAAPSPPHRARLLPASVRLLCLTLPARPWPFLVLYSRSASQHFVSHLVASGSKSACSPWAPGGVFLARWVLCQAHPLTALRAPRGLRLPLGGACAPDAAPLPQTTPAWVCPAKHGMVSPLLTLSQGLSRRGLGHSPSPHAQRGTQFVPLSHLEAGVSALQGAGPQHGQSPCRSVGRSAGLY